MDFLLNEELISYRHSLQKFFGSKPCLELLKDATLPRSDEADFPPLEYSSSEKAQALWQELADLGALAACIPEENEGLGFGFLSAALIVEESAKFLFAPPLFETLALCVVPLLCCGSKEQKARLLPQIARGEILGTGALDSAFALKGDRATLSGEVPFVPSAPYADLLILRGQSHGSSATKVRKSDNSSLFLLERSELQANSLKCTQLSTFDKVRRYDTLSLQNAACQVLGGVSSEALTDVLLRIEVLSAAELAGLGARVLEMSVEYAKTRKQFGSAIGSFQAIQHTLADMLLVSEQATSLARFAASVAERDPSQFRNAAMAAKAYASDEIPKLVESAIQVHGGIGFTYEYELHLYLRRAKMLAGQHTPSQQGYLRLANALLDA